MSTKIYHGFRFISRGLGAVHRQLMGLRPAVHAAQLGLMTEWLARESAGIIDLRALGRDEAPGQAPLSAALERLWDRQAEIRKSGRRDPDVDWEFSLSVLPFRGRVYGLTFIESRRLRDVLFASGHVGEYAWWDSTDRPESMSLGAWAARGRVWNDLLAQDRLGRPSGCGFTFQIDSPRPVPAASAVAAAVRPLAERVEKHAMNAVIGKLLKRAQEAFEGTEAEWNRQIMGAAFRAMDAARSDASKEALAAERARIAALLQEAIGVGDLQGR